MKYATGTIAMPMLLWIAAQPASAAPAWGGNCLSCHDSWQTDALVIFGADDVADPDESSTNAPDRGLLKVFQVSPGQTATLYVDLLGFEVEDSYAVSLRRLGFPGVESAGDLLYTGDCAWAEWGDEANYYSDPAIEYCWGDGPESFAFEITVEPGTSVDYYDLVFAVAGVYHDNGGLHYGSEHFYLQVVLTPGDLNGDGTVAAADLAILLGSWGLCPDCPADLNGDGAVEAADLAILLGNWG